MSEFKDYLTVTKVAEFREASYGPRIVIETIPHKEQRYPTLGDYWIDANGDSQIRVSDFEGLGEKPHLYSLLIAFHELIEQALCLDRGIPEESITAFDKRMIDEDSPWQDEPGDNPEAPYHREHVFASCIERLFAAELGVDWHEYERACLKLDSPVPVEPA